MPNRDRLLTGESLIGDGTITLEQYRALSDGAVRDLLHDEYGDVGGTDPILAYVGDSSQVYNGAA